MNSVGNRKRPSTAHFFLPRHSNGRHPHIFRTTSMLATVAAIFVLQVGFFAYQLTIFTVGPNIAAIFPAAVALMTNEARTEANTVPLNVNETLTKAAQQKADDMVQKGYFAHREPNGQMPWHWFTDNGYAYSYAGENLAVNFSDTQQLINAWLASPTHKENILRPQYTDIGVGMATGTHKGREAVFVVQFFGRPKDTPQIAASTQLQVINTDIATNVLGAATSESAPKLNWLQKLLTSPRSANITLLLSLAGLVALFLALNVTSSLRAHPHALLNGFLILAVIVSLYAYQDKIFGLPEVLIDEQTSFSHATSN